MNLKDRIIATKCENNAYFAARYAFKQATGTKMKPLHARVKPLAVVQDLMRRGCTDPLAQEEARQAIIDAVDLLLLHPEEAHHLMAVVRAAHEIAREPEPKASGPLNDSDLDQQIEDEF
ncbi:TPA: hypothetical protein ROS33_000379 [Escherichia coli]|uniref:hypothetical protein n=1 Tax=Escherichia coli TaxID=562 RepID=UPI0002510A95|nr:hypothetical protein [Escherichia coli]EFN6800703.1 hypothetical protein [Escherichia coli O22:H8]ELO0451471.1 hypothetical protein [Escherichia coli O55]EEQ2121192.1 hypothetical protein [Escherichia coli]EES5059468.1 hypothetical protein [Escherichia coli]EET5422389.1 hypothetical protein [Escherichia coli]